MHSKKNSTNASLVDKAMHDGLAQLALPPSSVILVGLSGGPDSVALLHALKSAQLQFNFKLVATHLNHEWRVNANLDVEFCVKLCQDQQIPLITAKASELTYAPKYNGSKEAHGRALRQYFFTQVAQVHKANIIALGHHLDDQIETFLINIMRGSGPLGLCGMPNRGTYFRPFLQVDKPTILDYVKQHQLPYVIDETNNSELFLRNRIRKHLPALLAVDQRSKSGFAKAITHLQAQHEFLQTLVSTTLTQLQTESSRSINLNQFLALPTYLQTQVLRHWLEQNQIKFHSSTNFIAEILRFLHQHKSSMHQLGPNWQLQKQISKHTSTVTII